MLPSLASPIIDDRDYGKECCLSLHKSKSGASASRSLLKFSDGANATSMKHLECEEIGWNLTSKTLLSMDI
jgi:hypothetical protein